MTGPAWRSMPGFLQQTFQFNVLPYLVKRLSPKQRILHKRFGAVKRLFLFIQPY